MDSSQKLVYNNELKEHLSELQAVIEEDKNLLDVPSSWLAIKLLENDEIVEEKIEGSSKRNNIVNETQKVKDHLKGIFCEGSEEDIANARYAFIDG